MNKKDLAVVLVVAIFSSVFSILVTSKFLVSADSRQQKVEVVDKIATDFQLPDERFFNKDSLNPTVPGQVNTELNTEPFKTTK